MSRALASSFIVTVAVSALACGPGRTVNPPPPELTQNPPAPEPTASVEGDGDETPPVEPVTTAEVETPPEPVPTAAVRPPTANPPSPQPVHPPAPEGAHVTMRPDGTCWAFAKMNCPKGTPDRPAPTCNPPPPRQVQCPPDATPSN